MASATFPLNFTFFYIFHKFLQLSRFENMVGTGRMDGQKDGQRQTDRLQHSMNGRIVN